MTPQEKKRLSYLKDRRNMYGENSKSSRRNIARQKRLRSREERRVGKQGLRVDAGEIDPEWIDTVESRVVKKRRAAWIKSPDEPLVVVLERKFSRRAQMGIMSQDAARRLTEQVQKRSRL